MCEDDSRDSGTNSTLQLTGFHDQFLTRSAVNPAHIVSFDIETLV